MSQSRVEAAQKAIHESRILDELGDYDPVVVSTILVGLDTPTSDIDIVCCYQSQTKFVNVLTQVVGKYAEHDSVSARKERHVVGRFKFAGFEFEIYGSQTAVEQQDGYRHYRVMERLVAIGRLPFQSAIKQLKRNGLKTEPAIANLLKLEGEPYQAVLTLEDLSDEELAFSLSNNPAIIS